MSVNRMNRLLGIIYGAVGKAYRHLGGGYSAAAYHAAVVTELRRLQLRVRDRPPLQLTHQGVILGSYTPDCIVCFGDVDIILDFKAVDKNADEKPFTQEDYDRMRHYLGLYRKNAVGLLVNFGGKAPSWRKVERRSKIKLEQEREA